VPEAPQDDLPSPHARRLPDRRQTRRPHRAGHAEHEAGTNPLGLIFPSGVGKHWRSSKFNRSVLKRAYLPIGWRDSAGNGSWTWHSLRHVFCTTALFTWKLDPTDESCMAGHANVRTTLLMASTLGNCIGRARNRRSPGQRSCRIGSAARRYRPADVRHLHDAPAGCMTRRSPGPPASRWDPKQGTLIGQSALPPPRCGLGIRRVPYPTLPLGTTAGVLDRARQATD
jgi:hypothetical protein